MNRRGFTIMELLTVIALIATLAAILFPVFARARESARRAKCAANLHQIGLGLSLYARDNSGQFPRRNNEFWPVYKYAHNGDVFLCPSDAYDTTVSPVKPAEHTLYSSYVYRGGLCSEDRADSVIAGESKVWHGTANILFLGGRVESVPEIGYQPIVRPRTKLPDQPGPWNAQPPAPPPPPK